MRRLSIYFLKRKATNLPVDLFAGANNSPINLFALANNLPINLFAWASKMQALMLAAALLLFSDGSVAMRLDEQALPMKLSGLGEPSLYQQARVRGFEAYRFIWQPTKGEGLLLRLNVRPDGTATLLNQRFSTGGKGELGAEALRTGAPIVKALRIEQVSLFRAYMRIADFWRMPTLDTFKGDLSNLWTLEGARQGNYRWLTRNAPKDMYFIDAAIYLVRLAGLNTAEFLVKDAKVNWMHG